MRISLETKITTGLSLAIGVAYVYQGSYSWLTGLALGAIYGHLKNKSLHNEALNIKKRPTFRELNAAELGKKSLPGIITFGVNIAAYLSVYKAALATIFKNIPVNLFAGFAGALVGSTMASYAHLKSVERQSKQATIQVVL